MTAFSRRWIPYEPDRRSLYSPETARYDSYRSKPDRSRSRDRNKDIERDQDRDMDSSRRDSRDSRGVRSPRDTRKDAGHSKNLHLDTKFPDGPRRSVSSSTNSPASAMPSARPTPTEPAAHRMAKGSALSNTVSATIPKAKDPKLQEVFQVLYKWSETSQSRTLLKLRKDALFRENKQRQDECHKVANKAGDYSPYSEFQRRFEESGKVEVGNVSKQLSKLDQQYAEELENVISSISSHASIKLQAAQAVEAAHSAAERNSLQTLEDKFAEFQKQASEQQKQNIDAQGQIQALLRDQKKSLDALDTLDKDFKSLKSDYGALQSENLQLKQQVASLVSMKGTQDKSDLQSVMARMDEVEAKATTFANIVEGLDIETFEEIIETWVDHDFKNKVPANERTVVALRQDLKSFRESTASRFNESDSRIQETRKTLDAVKHERRAEPQPKSQISDGQLELRAYVEEKLKSLTDVVQQTVADSSDACGEMVDEVGQRVEKIEALAKILEQSNGSNKIRIDKMDASLQQIAAEERTGIERLGRRVEALEGTTSKTIDLEKRVYGLQQASANKGPSNSDLIVNVLSSQLEEVKSRLSALEVVTRTLDTQWANIGSTHMANRIIEQLNPYSQKNEVQLAGIEKEIQQLKDRILNAEQQFRSSRIDAKTAPPDGKRHSSPGPTADEILKKRKLLPQISATPSMRSSSNNL
ncbi:hypothetical protein F5Y04DRAFT_148541 [Hypomontagnella monticulosa]|nr:hypothetical protein F5Y04DRAFT_148541 [Hypomontagnella monticulosa]